MKNNRKHGLANKISEYNIWCGIKSRCCNINNPAYKNYGGRGIKVCQSWIHSFENFYHDMGPKPSNEYSIERIDNDGNYCPNNCRWANRKEQASNKRNNRTFIINNEKKILMDLQRKYNIDHRSLSKRLELGWSLEDTINKPIRKKRRIEYNGLSLTTDEWATRLNVDRKTIENRLKAGWPIEQVVNKPSRNSKNG